jgi:hypothetical protein
MSKDEREDIEECARRWDELEKMPPGDTLRGGLERRYREDCHEGLQ